MSASYDVERIRSRFPSLSREVAGRPAAFLDGPAGSQVPQVVIDAVGGYLATINANTGGAFVTSRESEALLDEAHRAVADFFGADDARCTVFGPNMTTLTLALARALAKTLSPRDELVVTRLDHDANFTPWIQAAADAGATVRRAGLRRDDCTLDLDDLYGKLNDRTRLVAVTAASNAVGSMPPLREIAERVHDAGAELFVDAVHCAPHVAIDVEAWDCDYVVASAYKFFGPHIGMLWGRREALERLPAYRLRPQPDDLPGRWMPGTQSHEGIAGTLAAIDYLAELGREHADRTAGRREALLTAYDTIGRYERPLLIRLLDGLAGIPDVRVHGITAPDGLDERVPTVSFTMSGRTPREIESALGEQGIFVWAGNYYALPVTEALGLEPDGMVRVGLLHYNTGGEVERLLEALKDLS